MLISICDVVPTVALLNAFSCSRAQSRTILLTASQNEVQFMGQVVMMKRNRHLACHLAILRSVQIQRQRPTTHCLDQSRMRAAYFCRVDIGEAVRL